MIHISRLSTLLLILLAGTNAFAKESYANKAELGKALFFDTRLSLNQTQSCATCHDPANAFTDGRDNGVAGAVSLGDDGKSLGDRNAPTAAYASITPAFHLDKEGKYKGGQFHDGREKNLTGQAGGPPLNPIEMNMPDKATVLTRLEADAAYNKAFKTLFGGKVLNDPDTAYAVMAESIASFEKTDYFAPFDSKYDRYLRGEYTLTNQEDLGLTLFFSQQFTNCNICHQLKKSATAEGETFSNYEYHNIGTPANTKVRAVNGVAKNHIDHGLLDNPQVADKKQDGKFKVPTLRNIAVTGPYMHNGVFQELRTVVLFYNKYNSRSKRRQINPETGEQWQAPEVSENLSMEELETGPALNDKRIDALVAFMKTLTDQRYEHLLTDKK